ncbi:unnamed protein product [Linum trigynum]|uniref:Uncharacterized protein n=1 Tax=Linum trigynum TaxID=586398 RepID=A0AAV2FXG6_9ROSI
MSSKKPSREEELINQALKQIDCVMATCRMMITSYDKSMLATRPSPPEVKTLAAIEEEEISILPVATQKVHAAAESTPSVIMAPPLAAPVALIAKPQQPLVDAAKHSTPPEIEFIARLPPGRSLSTAKPVVATSDQVQKAGSMVILREFNSLLLFPRIRNDVGDLWRGIKGGSFRDLLIVDDQVGTPHGEVKLIAKIH